MKRPNKRKNFCDLCWAFWHVDVCNGSVVRSAKVLGQPDVEPTLCPDHRADIRFNQSESK
jgi:hypothetical protein